MPEKPLSNTMEPKVVRNFARAASFKMKKKVKTLSRALTFKKRSWDLSQNAITTKSNSDQPSKVDINQNEATYTLLAGLDEVYQSVLETSRDLATEIEKLENTPRRVGIDSLSRDDGGMVLQSVHDNFDKINFEEIDSLALELSEKDYGTLDDLVEEVKMTCKSDAEIVRCLFRWVVVVSCSTRSCKTPGRSPHTLFTNLCSIAGLDSEVITGWSKSAGYRPGMSFQNQGFRNTWTAVSIDGTWRFVNCAWASRHTTGTSKQETVERFDDFYFFTSPEDHIHQHFPDDPVWQLLDSTISLEEFTNLPLLKPAFFRHDLQFSSPYEACIKTNSSTTEIRLSAPEIFRYGSVLESVDGTKRMRVEKCVLHRIVGKEMISQLVLPGPGQYYFSLYVGGYWQPEALELACVLRIDYTEVNRCFNQLEIPFPPVSSLGPSLAMATSGVTTDLADPLVILQESTYEINFDLSSDMAVTYSYQYLDSSSGSLVDVDRYAFLTTREDDRITYTLRCHQKGYYVFSVFASTHSCEPLECVYKCLLVSQQDHEEVHKFPTSHSNWRNCSLVAPLCGGLQPNHTHSFQLDVPKADEVYLSVNGENHHLTRNSEQIWGGQVTIPLNCSSCRVMAGFFANRVTSPLVCLLDFDISDSKETAV